MAAETTIEWTDATWTPIRARNKATGKVGWHCEHASPGCQHCYSESFNAKRLGTGLPFKPGHRGDVEHFLDEAMLLQPLRWRRPRKIFVCSMTDMFGEWVKDAWIDRVFAVMALAPQHTFQVLTKRSARMRAYLSAARAHPVGLQAMDVTLHEMARNPRSDVGRGCILQGDICHLKVWPLPNVWLGVSADDQRRADERVPDLLATPAAVRFVSAEPLIGPIDFGSISDTDDGSADPWPHRVDALTGDVSDDANGIIEGAYAPGEAPRLSWIIVGGESGAGARPMHPAWARQIRDQCAAAGVAFHFKQWGTYAPGGPAVIFGDVTVWRDTPSDAGPSCEMLRVGKKAAGRLLDGITHNGMPEARHGC